MKPMIELMPMVDWFNTITCGIIIGWWMRALYGWASARSVRPAPRTVVLEKDDEAPLPSSATPAPEPAPAEAAEPNHEADNRDHAGQDRD